jgi:hypothetical protein
LPIFGATGWKWSPCTATLPATGSG